MRNQLLRLVLFFPCLLFAKDFGRVGETFAVKEKSLLEYIKQQASANMFDREAYRKEIEDYVMHPTPIEGIGKVLEKRSFIIDPTYKVEQDLVLPDGTVLAKAGAEINPLDTLKLPGGFLFLDGNDASHIAWAKKELPDFQWVLVSGSPIDLEKREKRPVYFDQLALLTTRFQIKNVPAKVMQEKNHFVVEEILIDEQGNEP